MCTVLMEWHKKLDKKIGKKNCSEKNNKRIRCTWIVLCLVISLWHYGIITWCIFQIINFVKKQLENRCRLCNSIGTSWLGRLRVYPSGWLLQSQSQWPVKMSNDFYPLRMRCNVTVTSLSSVTCLQTRNFDQYSK